jgi:hypothetical protein
MRNQPEPTGIGCIAAAPTLNGLAAVLNADAAQALGTPEQSQAVLTRVQSDGDVFQKAAAEAVNANLYTLALEGALAGDKSAPGNVRFSYTPFIFSVTLLDQVCHIAG